MRIVVYGDCGFASGGWCYAEALREMGHEVLQIPDPDSTGLGRSLVTRAYRKLTRQLPERARERHVHTFLQTVRSYRPQLAIVLKGLHLGPDDVKALARECWVCNVNHDDFFSSNPSNWSSLQRDAIAEYNYVFCTRRVNVEEVQPYNKAAEFFPFAYFPRIHRPLLDPALSRPADLLFIGTYEEPRAKMLERLVRGNRLSLRIYGSQWNKLSPRSPLGEFVEKGTIVGDGYASSISMAKVSLGFLRKENRDEYTQRSFEIPACGGVLLAERTPEHQNMYLEGKEAEFFQADSNEELEEKIGLLLGDAAHRESLRERGYARVLGGRHTYHDRLHRLIEVAAKY